MTERTVCAPLGAFIPGRALSLDVQSAPACLGLHKPPQAIEEASRFQKTAQEADLIQAGVDEVVIWGTGTPRREFLHVDDMADASLFVFDLPGGTYAANTEPMLSHINIGTGLDVTIAELAAMIAEVVGYSGRIIYDATKPDGTMRKLLDVSRLNGMGWRAGIDLRCGLAETYLWFVENVARLREA